MGEMTDMNGSDKALHEALLDNPEADRKLSRIAVERAIAEDRMSREEAERIYGLNDRQQPA